MAKVAPASKVLYEEMLKAGFEEVIRFIPGGEGFWSFLKSMAEDGICTSCKGERCGNPGCTVRICAQEKGVEMCALCDEYPCVKFDDLTVLSPIMRQDNALLRDHGMDAWAKLQDERRENGFTYQDDKNARIAD
jgi:hypothetical protein